jgi:hypothetical protein
MNYSILEVYEMFKQKFNCNKIHIDDQKGNYRITKRENDDTLNRLGWSPEDRLQNYINTL